MAVVEVDEQWSYVENKHNQQWLWFVFYSMAQKVVVMHVGKQTKEAPEPLLKNCQNT